MAGTDKLPSTLPDPDSELESILSAQKILGYILIRTDEKSAHDRDGHAVAFSRCPLVGTRLTAGLP